MKVRWLGATCDVQHHRMRRRAAPCCAAPCCAALLPSLAGGKIVPARNECPLSLGTADKRGVGARSSTDVGSLEECAKACYMQAPAGCTSFAAKPAASGGPLIKSLKCLLYDKVFAAQALQNNSNFDFYNRTGRGCRQLNATAAVNATAAGFASAHAAAGESVRTARC